MPETSHDSARCPHCRAWMQEGYVSVSQGLLWRRHIDGSHRDFAQAIPGTHAVLRPNDLPAWRCHSCQMLLLKYGRDTHPGHSPHRAGPDHE